MEEHAVAEESPTGTNLTDTFKSVSEIEVQNKETALLMGHIDDGNPNTLPGGLISKLGITDAKLVQAKSKKRDKDFRNWLWREAIRRSLKHINDIIKDLQVRIEKLLEQMAEAEEELAELDLRHEILEAELEYYQEHGLFDCDEHGRLKKPEAEAIMAEWERKTGQTIDRTDPASYTQILKILMEIDGQRAALQERLARDAIEYETRKQQLDEARQIRDDLQSTDPAQNQEALAKLNGFMDGFAENIEFSVGEASEYPIERNDLTVASDDDQSIKLADEMAFGFPPIKDNFAHATSGDGNSTNANRVKPLTKTGYSPIVRQGQ